MENLANADHEILPVIAARWSPRAFADRPVEAKTLASLFEAARWTASCYGDQPWNYLLATREQPEDYQRLFECLVPFNQSWAKQAPVLAAAISQTTFKHNGQANAWGEYDLGQATATLALQATGMGLFVHQMAGFEAEKLIASFALPETFKPMAIIAIGYPGDPETLPEDLRSRELAPRRRLPLSSFVFSGTWGHPAHFG